MTDTVWRIGHYLGDFAGGHRLRIGGATVVLAGRAEFIAWALAGDQAAEPYVDRVAQELGASAEAIVTALRERGALAVTSVDTPVAFARGHRLRAMLTAIGSPTGAPFAIGLGEQVHALMDDKMRDIWLWAGAAGNLWALCEHLDPAEPERILAHFWLHGHGLLGAGAAYLDPA